MTTVTKTRNQTLDIAKGIGIVLVVFGHNWAVLHEKGELFRIIFSFHMPLFLFLSGVFLHESGSLKQLSISRMNLLLKPYFLTLLMIGVMKLSFDIFNGKQFYYNFLSYMSGVFYATGRTIAWPPLWYLPHLFIATCGAFLIIKFFSSNQARWIATAVLLGGGVLLLHPADLPWSIDLLPISISFLLSGYLCRNAVKCMEFKAIYFCISLASFLLLHFFFNFTIDLNLRVYDNLIVSTLQAILGIYLCLSVASFLANYWLFSRALGYIGSGTLFILLFHSFVQDKTFGLLTVPLGYPLAILGGLMAGVLLPLILWEITKRFNYVEALFLSKKSIGMAPSKP